MTTSAPWLLYVIAAILTIINGINGKVPLWIPLLLVCLGLIVSTAGR